MQFLRHLKDFFEIVFKIDADKTENPDGEDADSQQNGGKKVLLTCVGAGYRNLGKVHT